MTDLPIEVCKGRKVQREPLKRVPEEAIDKMYARFATQKIPTGITVLRPDELDRIWMHPIDLSQYKKILLPSFLHSSAEMTAVNRSKSSKAKAPLFFAKNGAVEII